MEVLTFIFLFLNIILLIVNGFLLYSIRFKLLDKQIIYSDFISDFWDKEEVKLDDLFTK